MRTAKWLALLGDRGYELALWLNNPLNWCAVTLGSLSGPCPPTSSTGSESAVAFIGAFEEAVATEAHRRNVDGVICGHIHHAVRPAPSAASTISIAVTGWKAARHYIETRAGRLRVVHWQGEGGVEPMAVLAPTRQLLPEHVAARGGPAFPLHGVPSARPRGNGRGYKRGLRDASLPRLCPPRAGMREGTTDASSSIHLLPWRLVAVGFASTGRRAGLSQQADHRHRCSRPAVRPMWSCIIGEQMSRTLGQQLVVENVGGRRRHAPA